MIFFIFNSAVGAGAVQSNMAVFGAEQTQESKGISRYFDKYVLVVNIGALIAMAVVPFLSRSADIYYHLSIFALVALFVSAVSFIIGWRYYIHGKPYDSVIINCIPVIINACQTWRKCKKSQPAKDNSSESLSISNTMNIRNDSHAELIRGDERPKAFLDYAKVINHGKFIDRIVDDVKSLQNAFIVFSLLIPYWIIYSQVIEHTIGY